MKKRKQLKEFQQYNPQELMKIAMAVSDLGGGDIHSCVKALRKNKYLALYSGVSCTIICPNGAKLSVFYFIDPLTKKVMLFEHEVLSRTYVSIINKFSQQDIPYLETLMLSYKVHCLKVNLAQHILFLYIKGPELIKAVIQQFADVEEIEKLKLSSFPPALNFIMHPLYNAVFYSDFDLAKKILNKKLRIDLVYRTLYQSQPLLEVAIINKAPVELIEEIIKLVPEQVHQYRPMNPFLTIACEVDLSVQHKNNLLLILLKAGANPNIPCENGMTPLMICARDGNIQGVELLINYQADINFPFQLAGNPYTNHKGHFKSGQASVSCQSLLLELSVKVTVPELVSHAQSSFLTVPGAMTFAISTARKDIIELLLQYGSDLPIQIVDDDIKWVTIRTQGVSVDEERIEHEMSTIVRRVLLYQILEELRIMLNDIQLPEEQKHVIVSSDIIQPVTEVSRELVKLSEQVQEKIKKILKIYTTINSRAQVEQQITILLIEALTSNKPVEFLTAALQDLLFAHPEANAVIIAIACVLKADLEDPTEFILNLMTDPKLLHRYFQKEFDSLLSTDSPQISSDHTWVLAQGVMSSRGQHVYEVLSNSVKSKFFIHIPDDIWQSHNALLMKLDSKDLKFISQNSQRINGIKIFKHAIELKIIDVVEGDLRLSSHTMYRNSKSDILIVFDYDTDHAGVFTEYSKKIGISIIDVPTAVIRVNYLTKVMFNNPLLNRHDITEAAIKLKLLPFLLELELDQARELLELIDSYEDTNSILLKYLQPSLVINNPVFFKTLRAQWLKNLLYYQELTKLRKILQQYNINMSFEEALSSKGLRQLSLKLHPDKGGNKEDFAFVSDLKAKFDADVDVRAVIDNIVRDLQLKAHKISVGAKCLDTAVDALRLYLEPTAPNFKAVVLDAAHLASMTLRFSKVSSAAVLLSVGHTYYNEGVAKAAWQGVVSIGYMAVPYTLKFAGIPYVGFAYGVGIAYYSACHAATNAYSFYNEYTSEQSELRSATAYMDAYKWAAGFKPDWFKGKVLEYEIKINSIKLRMEQAAYQDKLNTAGEFGQKLYEHIYEPYLQEKYALSSKVILQELAQKTANHQISSMLVKFVALDYDVCREVQSSDDSKHYYCANEKKQLLQHIATVAGSSVLVIEDL